MPQHPRLTASACRGSWDAVDQLEAQVLCLTFPLCLAQAPQTLATLEVSLCVLHITLSTPSGKIPYSTSLFHHFSDMTNLYSRCGLLNAWKNTNRFLNTYYRSEQPHEVDAIIKTCFTEKVIICPRWWQRFSWKLQSQIWN